ncbi:MAG: 3-oxoacyl-ACP reductase FabG [Crocinitomicaceae bacterium]|nr:3-oxoacyl-ACP reductase FabG [Crocinitomicaceae bacterium]
MKYALVTGGSRGIGRVVCQKLAEQGYHILINFKSNRIEAEKTAELVRASGVEVELIPFNTADHSQVESVLGSWIEKNKEKHIEILVNNAGIRQDTLLMWMTDMQWKDVLGTSLDGFFHVTQQVISGMLQRRYGRIINVASLSGIKGMPGQTNYSAAKAGLIGATKALAQEVGRRGVTVNAVAPGFIRTDMTTGLKEDELKSLIPVQRFGEPEEVADAIAFLASPKASYITAEVLNINGGLYS